VQSGRCGDENVFCSCGKSNRFLEERGRSHICGITPAFARVGSGKKTKCLIHEHTSELRSEPGTL